LEISEGITGTEVDLEARIGERSPEGKEVQEGGVEVGADVVVGEGRVGVETEVGVEVESEVGTGLAVVGALGLGLVEEGGICEIWACCSGGYLFNRTACV